MRVFFIFNFFILCNFKIQKSIKFLTEYVSEQSKSSYIPDKLITKDSFSPDLAKYFIYYASYGYCKSEEIGLGKCCSSLINEQRWKYVYYFQIDYFDINFSVLRNDQYNKIIFTFTGTRDPYEFFQEFLNSDGIFFRESKYEKVLTFFYKAYMSLADKMKDIIVKLQDKYSNSQYIFLGHSLGGALASISILDVIRNKLLDVTKYNPVLITYGQPRTGNDIFSNELMKNVPTIFRIMRKGDFVGNFPRCKTRLLKNCGTILQESKFNQNLIISGDEEKLEAANYFAWHIGGLKLFSDDFENFSDCGLEYGDNNPNEECDISLSLLSIVKHTHYFGIKVSKYCRLNP